MSNERIPDLHEEERQRVQRWAEEARGLGLSRVAFFLTVAESYVVDLAVSARTTDETLPEPSPFLYTLQ